MKRISFILGFLLLFSCNYFTAKKTSSEAILNEELKAFNWNEVDDYPSFALCDTAASKEFRKLCFQNTLTNVITDNLQKETIIVKQDVNDTITIKFQISETGILSLIDVTVDSITLQEIPDIKSMLTSSLDSLPKIYPALKRGQQVKTEFRLPVVIQVN